MWMQENQPLVDKFCRFNCDRYLFCRLLTGQVDDRTIQKYEREAKEKNRESWYLAYVMDTNEEERAKGKTVEVGRAHFETPNKRYTILDAPGHKNYVPNMIGGAAQADIGILVRTITSLLHTVLHKVLYGTNRTRPKFETGDHDTSCYFRRCCTILQGSQ